MIGTDAIVDEAARRVIPLTIIDVSGPSVELVYERKLTLIRPDLMVAWRGNTAPRTASALWDRVTGWLYEGE